MNAPTDLIYDILKNHCLAEHGDALDYVDQRNGYATRAEAGAALCVAGQVHQDIRNPTMFWVQSVTHGQKGRIIRYRVHPLGEPPSCECEDYASRRAPLCMHIVAARMEYAILSALADAAAPTPGPTLEQDSDLLWGPPARKVA